MSLIADGAPLRFEHRIDVTPIRQRKRSDAREDRPRLPRLQAALLMGHQIERVIREGQFADYGEVAAATGVSRARISQVVGLTLLAPDIQEAILALNPAERRSPPERLIRPIVAEPDWARQRERWAQVAEPSAD